jgi:hypothetical protein
MNTHPSLVPHPSGENPKPVRELLEDIHQRSGFASRPRGVLNPRSIDQIAFGATVLTVVISAGILLAMVWEAVDSKLGLQSLASVFIVLFALLIFRSVNRTFSE